MKFDLKATNLSLTSAINDYVSGKLSSLERFLDPKDESVQAKVELGKETGHHKHGFVFRAEIHLRFAGGSLYASASEEDLYAAIDRMKDEIVREIKTSRQKQNTIFRRGGRLVKTMLRGLHPRNWRLSRRTKLK